VIAAVDESKVFAKPLPLTVLPRVVFWPAEDYHQNYAAKNPLRYSFYRQASGRTAFITKHWGDRATIFEFSTALVAATATTSPSHSNEWEKFVIPGEAELRNILSPLSYKVTQEEGTEPPRSSELDKNYEPGIYVDIVSGEPLFLSSDKYDSGTGWPSFVKAITPEVVTLHEDRKLFSTRTEVRSRYANSHLGHVFTDGPQDRGGMRYCMNGAALRFVPLAEMEEEGYGEYMPIIQ
jgi:peptide methionine sulfoxide reductase msrA/msrB